MDAKGRLAMPARQREPLLAHCDGQIVITIDSSSPCLVMYPLPEWERIEREIRELPAMKPAMPGSSSPWKCTASPIAMPVSVWR